MNPKTIGASTITDSRTPRRFRNNKMPSPPASANGLYCSHPSGTRLSIASDAAAIEIAIVRE